jgi:hypothetical protein
MNNIYDVLEICLQELEAGAELEFVLESVRAHYPDLVSELRPILKASVMVGTMAVPVPSPDAMRRGRAKLLQRAAQMREEKVAPRKRMIPAFQRLAISFTLTALFLTSGTGLVSASSSALPGENLYPVKLTWENVRLFLTFNEEHREILEDTFENERLHEVNELFVEGRDETIQFAGVYMNANGVVYVSGIHIAILSTSTLPAEPLLNGAAVVITGHTNAQGFVDVESIELLPAGTAVPTGEPVEVEQDYNNTDNGGEVKKENEENDVNDKSINNGNEHSNNESADDSAINGNENSSGGNGADSNNGDNGNSNGGGDRSDDGSGDGGGGD